MQNKVATAVNLTNSHRVLSRISDEAVPQEISLGLSQRLFGPWTRSSVRLGA